MVFVPLVRPVARRCSSAARAAGGTSLFLAVALRRRRGRALDERDRRRRARRSSPRSSTWSSGSPRAAATRAPRCVAGGATGSCDRWPCAVALACVLGAGVLAHLWLQARALGEPVSYRFLDPDWLDRAALEHYFGRAVPRRRRSPRSLLVLTSRGCATTPPCSLSRRSRSPASSSASSGARTSRSTTSASSTTPASGSRS